MDETVETECEGVWLMYLVERNTLAWGEVYEMGKAEVEVTETDLEVCVTGEAGGGGRVRTRVLLADCCFTLWKLSMSAMNWDTSSRNCLNSTRPASTSSLYGLRGSSSMLL